MNLEDYDFDRLLGFGYTEKATGDLKNACWKGYTAVGLKKKGGRTVPNCVPIKKSDHSEDGKHKPLIAGPSVGSPSFGEGKGTGKPCGDSHISAKKTCKVGQGSVKRDPSKDVKRGNTLIGTSPKNMSIDNLNEVKKEYEDYKKKFGHRADVKSVMDAYEKRIADAEKAIKEMD
jgi:hypothetical protein